MVISVHERLGEPGAAGVGLFHLPLLSSFPLALPAVPGIETSVSFFSPVFTLLTSRMTDVLCQKLINSLAGGLSTIWRD